jgi:serine/threonine protein kinase
VSISQEGTLYIQRFTVTSAGLSDDEGSVSYLGLAHLDHDVLVYPNGAVIALANFEKPDEVNALLGRGATGEVSQAALIPAGSSTTELQPIALKKITTGDPKTVEEEAATLAATHADVPAVKSDVTSHALTHIKLPDGPAIFLPMQLQAGAALHYMSTHPPVTVAECIRRIETRDPSVTALLDERMRQRALLAETAATTLPIDPRTMPRVDTTQGITDFQAVAKSDLPDTLKAAVVQEKERLTAEKAAKVPPASHRIAAAIGMFENLNALHNQGILHRDVKTENAVGHVAVNAEGQLEALVRMIDFGNAYSLTDADQARGFALRPDIAGSPKYMPSDLQAKATSVGTARAYGRNVVLQARYSTGTDRYAAASSVVQDFEVAQTVMNRIMEGYPSNIPPTSETLMGLRVELVRTALEEKQGNPAAGLTSTYLTHFLPDSMQGLSDEQLAEHAKAYDETSQLAQFYIATVLTAEEGDFTPEEKTSIPLAIRTALDTHGFDKTAFQTAVATALHCEVDNLPALPQPTARDSATREAADPAEKETINALAQLYIQALEQPKEGEDRVKYDAQVKAITQAAEESPGVAAFQTTVANTLNCDVDDLPELPTPEDPATEASEAASASSEAHAPPPPAAAEGIEDPPETPSPAQPERATAAPQLPPHKVRLAEAVAASTAAPATSAVHPDSAAAHSAPPSKVRSKLIDAIQMAGPSAIENATAVVNARLKAGPPLSGAAPQAPPLVPASGAPTVPTAASRAPTATHRSLPSTLTSTPKRSTLATNRVHIGTDAQPLPFDGKPAAPTFGALPATFNPKTNPNPTPTGRPKGR